MILYKAVSCKNMTRASFAPPTEQVNLRLHLITVQVEVPR